jgi:RNA polymerase sigma-70 factor (ECF subfamily)
MSDTPISLLERIRGSGADASWARLVEAYGPMIRRWLGQAGMAEADVDDIAQEVLLVVLAKLPDFDRQRTGSFRNWLRKVTLNCLRDYRKAVRRRRIATEDSRFENVIQELADADSRLSRLWNAEHDQQLLRYLLSQVRENFSPATVHAFTRVVLDEQSPDTVAAELGMTVNAIFIAKSRVLARLRECGEGLIE